MHKREQDMTDVEFIEYLGARLEYELQNQQKIEEEFGKKIFVNEKEAEQEDEKWLAEISWRNF